MDPIFIDTTLGVREFIEQLPTGTERRPSLFVDLEGNDLCRHGTISLLTVLVEPRKTVYLIDVTKLGHEAFSTATSSGHTLKSVLESSEIVKVFFDIRNDSDALFSLFGVRVAGIQDLQLIGLASRSFSKKCVNGLSKCISNDAPISFAEKRQWEATKASGRKLFAPERGGSYSVFDARPLSADLAKYCAQDVLLMPGLRDVYCGKLCDAWWTKIEAETAARIALSQSAGYNGKGKHMALGPPGWMYWTPSSEERHVRTRFQEPETHAAAESSSTTSVLEQSSAPPAEVNDLGPLARTLMLMMARPSPSTSDDDDGYAANRYSAVGFGRSSHSRFGGSGDEDEAFSDLTACDSECGYCGQCPY